MQSQKEMPADFSACKDKFLVQSVRVSAAAAEGLRSGPTAAAEFASLFGADAAQGGVTEAKLRVQYVSPAPPPSPVVEEPEGGEGRAGGAPGGSAGGGSGAGGASAGGGAADGGAGGAGGYAPPPAGDAKRCVGAAAQGTRRDATRRALRRCSPRLRPPDAYRAAPQRGHLARRPRGGGTVRPRARARARSAACCAAQEGLCVCRSRNAPRP